MFFASLLAVPLLATAAPEVAGASGHGATGATEQSTKLMSTLTTLNAIAVHTAATPLTIMFQPGGTYWLDYTLRPAHTPSRADPVYKASSFPTIGTFDFSYTTFDLNGATLQQRTVNTSDPRVSNGDAIMFTNGVQNVTVKNATLTNPTFDANHPRPVETQGWYDVDVSQNSWKIKPNQVAKQEPHIAPSGGPWSAPITTPNTYATTGC